MTHSLAPAAAVALVGLIATLVVCLVLELRRR